MRQKLILPKKVKTKKHLGTCYKITKPNSVLISTIISIKSIIERKKQKKFYVASTFNVQGPREIYHLYLEHSDGLPKPKAYLQYHSFHKPELNVKEYLHLPKILMKTNMKLAYIWYIHINTFVK